MMGEKRIACRVLPEDVEDAAAGRKIAAGRKSGDIGNMAARERVHVGFEIGPAGVGIARHDQTAPGERAEEIIEATRLSLKAQLQRPLRIAFAVARIVRDIGRAVVDIVAALRFVALR